MDTDENIHTAWDIHSALVVAVVVVDNSLPCDGDSMRKAKDEEEEEEVEMYNSLLEDNVSVYVHWMRTIEEAKAGSTLA